MANGIHESRVFQILAQMEVHTKIISMATKEIYGLDKKKWQNLIERNVQEMTNLAKELEDERKNVPSKV